jgi:hypothetical protein
MATYRPVYTASATITIAPQGVATSAARTAGVESTVVSNISDLYSTVLISGKWTAGTSPTAGTRVDLWVYVPESDDLGSTVVYPDPAGTIDGTSSAETITSENVRNAALWPVWTAIVDSTSNRGYSCRAFSLVSYLGFMPTRWGLFLSHDTGVNSNSTAGNHAWSYIGVKYESV